MFEIHSGHGELMAQSDTFWWEGGQVQHTQSEPKRKRQRVAKRSGTYAIGDGISYGIGDGTGDAIGDITDFCWR